MLSRIFHEWLADTVSSAVIWTSGTLHCGRKALGFPILKTKQNPPNKLGTESRSNQCSVYGLTLSTPKGSQHSELCASEEGSVLQLCVAVFPVQVVEYGLFVKHYKVEVYLLELKLCESSDPDNVISCHFSKADTVGK